MNHLIHIVELRDANDFNSIIVRRAFTSATVANEWAERMRDSIVTAMKNEGEDLTDIKIEIKIVTPPLDDLSVNPILPIRMRGY